jgi:hypothetical protein
MRLVYPDKQSLVATYRFEPQETKLKNGDVCKIALTLDYAGSIVDLDTDEGKGGFRGFEVGWTGTMIVARRTGLIHCALDE